MKSAKILVIVLGFLSVVSAQDIHQVAGGDFVDHQDYEGILEKRDIDYDKQDTDVQLPVNDAEVDDYPDIQLGTFAKKTDSDVKSQTQDNDDNENAVAQDFEIESAYGENEPCGYNCCPNNWIGYNNKCYRAFSTAMSWTSARDYCRETGPGGTLARSYSQELNVFLAKAVSLGTRNLWIGLIVILKEIGAGWTVADICMGMKIGVHINPVEAISKIVS